MVIGSMGYFTPIHPPFTRIGELTHWSDHHWSKYLLRCWRSARPMERPDQWDDFWDTGYMDRWKEDLLYWGPPIFIVWPPEKAPKKARAKMQNIVVVCLGCHPRHEKKNLEKKYEKKKEKMHEKKHDKRHKTNTTKSTKKSTEKAPKNHEKKHGKKQDHHQGETYIEKKRDKHEKKHGKKHQNTVKKAPGKAQKIPPAKSPKDTRKSTTKNTGKPHQKKHAGTHKNAPEIPPNKNTRKSWKSRCSPRMIKVEANHFIHC